MTTQERAGGEKADTAHGQAPAQEAEPKISRVVRQVIEKMVL